VVPFLFYSENSRVRLRQLESVVLPCKLAVLVLFLSLTVGCATSAKSESTASIGTADTNVENKARQEKVLADSLREKNKQQAVDHYLHALKIAPQIFTYQEKLTVAKLLVADQKRDEAIALLKEVMDEPHEGVEAELLLAKALSSNEKDAELRTAMFYVHAFQLAPQQFTYDEKLTVAKTLIKLQKPHDAKKLLQSIISEPHNGLTAELMLAKIRVSTGEYDAALDEADEILHRDEKNTGALLIKGSTLRRRKAFGEAIKAYRAILAKKDDFDARLSLIYCLLATGQKQEAEKQYKLLHPQYQWQQSDYDELTRNINVNVRPVVNYGYTQFSDSDNYTGVERDINARANFWNWDISLSARHRTTTGDGLVGIADTGILYLGKTISENIRFLAGLGETNISSKLDPAPVSDKKPFNIGELQIDAQVLNGTAQLSYSDQVLTSNAYLIQNQVTMKRSQLVYHTPVSTALTGKATYGYSEYSDNNVSNDFQALAFLALNRGAPQFSIGYAFKYMKYRQPSTLGYFDPENYVSNTLLFLAAYERGPFYLYAEYYTGQQTYTRHQAYHDDGINHFGLTTGITFWDSIRMDFGIEKNNSDAASSNFAYGDSSINWRVSYSF